MSDNKFKGPGHCSVIETKSGDEWVMIYHAWMDGHVCNGNKRVMLSDYVTWNSEDWPVVGSSASLFFLE